MKKRMLSVLLALSMTLSLSGWSGSSSEAAEETTVVVAVSGDMVSMHPHGKWNSDNGLFLIQVYDTLVQLNDNMELQPSVATSWEWADDTNLVLNLRDDVYFTNGEQLTAEDVAYTMQMAAQSEVISAVAGMIDPDNTYAIDEFTVNIATIQPFPALLTQLSHPNLGILCKSVVEADYDNYGINGEVVGSGPFKFVKTVAGDATYFDTNKDYWGTVPEFDHLTIRTIVEMSGRSIAVQNGEIDIAIKIRGSECTRLNEIEGVTLHANTGSTISMVDFNCETGVFSDPAVREAFTYALDTQVLIDSCYDGWAERAVGMLPPKVVGYDPTIVEDDYGYDPEKAREILAEAGYTEPIKSVLKTTESRRVLSEAIQAMVAEVGFELEIEVLDSATWLNDGIGGNFDLIMSGKNSGATGDAYYGLYMAFHTNSIDSNNWTRYSNPEVDDLLDAAASALDDEERAELYGQVQHKLMEPTELPWASIAYETDCDVYSSRIESYEPSPNLFTRFNTIVLASD